VNHNNDKTGQLMQSLEQRRQLAIEAEVTQYCEHYEVTAYVIDFWNCIDVASPRNGEIIRFEVYLRVVHNFNVADAYKLIHATRQITLDYDQRINEVYANGK
jgi:hypothetical protein